MENYTYEKLNSHFLLGTVFVPNPGISAIQPPRYEFLLPIHTRLSGRINLRSFPPLLLLFQFPLLTFSCINYDYVFCHIQINYEFHHFVCICKLNVTIVYFLSLFSFFSYSRSNIFLIFSKFLWSLAKIFVNLSLNFFFKLWLFTNYFLPARWFV